MNAGGYVQMRGTVQLSVFHGAKHGIREIMYCRCSFSYPSVCNGSRRRIVQKSKVRQE